MRYIEEGVRLKMRKMLALTLIIMMTLFTIGARAVEIDDSRLVSDNDYYELVRLLRISGAVYPSFSPDGRYLLVTTSLSGEPQLWRVDLSTGELSQLTYFSEGVTGGSWLPNGWILISKDVGGNEREQIILISPDASRLRKITDNPEAIYVATAASRDGRYLALYTNERDPKYFDVHIYDFQNEKLFPVLELNSFLVPVAFSDDGKILIVKEYLSNVESKLIALDLKDGSWRYLKLPVADYGEVEWVPGENGFLFITDEGSEYPYIAFYNLSTDEWTPVYKHLSNVEEIELTDDGRYLAVTQNVDGYSKLVVIDRLSGDEREVELPRGVIYSIESSNDSRYLAINISRSTYPASVYVYDLHTGELRLAAAPNTNGFTTSDFVEPKIVYYKSFDGTMIPALLYMPKELKGKAPCIIWYHGGPEGQARPNFSTFAQLMVRKGFVILRPNVRGSSGYGKSWIQADNVRNRWVSLKDGYWANVYLRNLDFVDPDRIYAFGGSYGGYMVLAQLTFWPNAWAGGVDVVGISDIKRFLERTGPWRRKVRISEYGDPVRDAEFLREVSPYYHAERITAPLLIVHGKNDPRVPVEQAEIMAERLRELNKPVELMIFEDEGHGVSKFKNRLKYYLKLLEFFGVRGESSLKRKPN